ncbi:MAG TPA: alternative ribosome rescue aminoacyl-tRNA hydrolase ArfB [Tepidisphaeraceae bacterium]|jgi:ribosome-associated protein|nr:alternative ribosome rescue aminoacyl-tRNA hydrolase ArfB [Tepidisphaeraceae bacterium]
MSPPDESMPDALPNPSPPTGAIQVSPTVWVPESAVRFQFARSGGPGGQHVNKVNTKAELWIGVGAIVGLPPDAVGRLRKLAGHRLTAAGEIHIISDASRSQESNRTEAIERFSELVRTALIRPKPRRKTKPSKAAKQRRIDSKKRRGQTKANRRAGQW